MLEKLTTRVAIKLHRQPDGTEDVVDIDRIIIQKTFRKCPPKNGKVMKAQIEFDRLGHIDKPITVREVENGKLLLYDGYTRYIVAKSNMVDKVAVCYKANDK